MWESIKTKIDQKIEKKKIKKINSILKELFENDIKTTKKLKKELEKKPENKDFILEKWNRLMEENLIELKKIIKKYGWEIIFKNENIFKNAWLITQHSDTNIDFQKEFFQKSKEFSEKIEYNKEIRYRLAMLEDRILVNSDKKQEYGSQFDQNGNIHPIRDINLDKQEDIIELNKRRKKVGMTSFEEYQKIMRKVKNKI